MSRNNAYLGAWSSRDMTLTQNEDLPPFYTKTEGDPPPEPPKQDSESK
jgi:hypothetical protein